MKDVGLMAFSLAVGGFTFFCAFKDYDWFMNNRRARIFVAILGRGGARWFYMLLGIAFLVGGLAMAMVSAV